MSDMRYEAPSTLDAAVALLAGASGVTRVLAGGTDLLIQMRGGRVEPALQPPLCYPCSRLCRGTLASRNSIWSTRMRRPRRIMSSCRLGT